MIASNLAGTFRHIIFYWKSQKCRFLVQLLFSNQTKEDPSTIPFPLMKFKVDLELYLSEQRHSMPFPTLEVVSRKTKIMEWKITSVKSRRFLASRFRSFDSIRFVVLSSRSRNKRRPFTKMSKFWPFAIGKISEEGNDCFRRLRTGYTDRLLMLLSSTRT